MALLAGSKKFNMFLLKARRLLLLLLLCMWTLHFPANDARANITTELYPKINGTSNVSVATLIKGSEFHDDSKDAIKTLNSLKSFTMLRGVTQVIILVEDSQSCASISKELSFSIKCVALEHRCHHATLFKPTMGCIFQQLRAVATTEALVFVNSDIVLFDGLMAAVHTLKSTLKKYIIVGRRLDVQHDVQVDVQNRLAHVALERNALHRGILHGDYGLDYFVMKTEHLPTDFPEFLIGTWRWDNTLLASFMSRGFDILDGTSVITALHQGLNSAQKADHTRRVGATYNDELAYSYMRRAYLVGRVDAADYELQMLDDRLAIVPKPQHRLHSLHKCILKQVSLGKPLLLLLTTTHDLKTLSQMQEWLSIIKGTNYLFLAGNRDDERTISNLNAKVCLVAPGKIDERSHPEVALQATNLLKVAQLGVDLVFSLVFAHDPTGITEVLSPIHFGHFSVHLYEANTVIKISSGEAGQEYLRKVAHCQERVSSRIWRCLPCFYSKRKHRELLERRYIQCFHRVWTRGSINYNSH
jgi:hypothetical protein